MAQLDLVPLDGLELEAWSVHQHIPVVQFLRHQLPEALLIDPELLQTGLRRNVQGLQRRPVHAAGDPQPVVLLEAAHGALQALGVVDAEQALAGPVLPLAAGGEAPVEEPDALIVVLRADRPRAGDRGPAAARDDLLIMLDCTVQRLDHLLAAQRYLVGAQIVESLRAAAIVVGRRPRSLRASESREILPPLGVLRERRRSKCGHRQRGRAAEDPARPIDQIRPVTLSLASQNHACLLFQASRLRCRSPPSRLHSGHRPNRRRQRHSCGCIAVCDASIPTMHRYGQTKTVH